MRQLQKVFSVIMIACSLLSCKHDQKVASSDVKMNSFVNDLIGKMTLEEKVGQLSLFTSDWSSTGPSMRNDYIELIRKGKAGAVFNAYTVDFVKELQRVAVEETRLHIPLLFGYDVIHGHRTIFPIPLGQSSTWDTTMIEAAERVAAIEASAEGLNWTFAPMVDIARDPRWGRVMEGSGEDTFLGSLISAARVRGFQGKSFSENNNILACVKHFAAYGAPQAGRDYHTVDMSERSLYEWYLPPYKAAIDAGVASVMTSFNEIAGVPSTSNKWLLTDLLRNDWKFGGFVVTDYGSISELIPHGVAADQSQAAMLSLNAGVDMDMQASAFLDKLPALAENKKVSIESIDNAVRRILEAKYKLGLFDNPYKYCDKKRESTEIMTPEFRTLARIVAAKSCVLLKNDNNTLPIPGKINTIALIGPLGDSKEDMLGFWSAAGDASKSVTLLEGLNNRFTGSVKVLTVKGCDIDDENTSEFAKAVSVARGADYVILAIGESRMMSGEAASRTNISLPGAQMKLVEAVLKAGKPTVVVLFNGRPLAIPELVKSAPAILETWFGGTEAGNAITDVLFGDINPSGKLTMTFPLNVGQIPVFYNSKNTGRPINPEHPFEKYKSNYLDSPNTPLFPFGYGLSYTTFKYSEIKLNKETFKGDEEIIASVDVTNAGKLDGEEIVQMYIRDLIGDVTRPVKELKGFKKVMIDAGETVTVSFNLKPSALSYYHQDMSFKYDPGEFEIFIGTNSEENKNKLFTIE